MISGMRLSQSENGSSSEDDEEYRLFSVPVKLKGRQEKLHFAVSEGGGLKVRIMMILVRFTKSLAIGIQDAKILFHHIFLGFPLSAYRSSYHIHFPIQTNSTSRT